MTTLSIDPGISGSICIVHEDGTKSFFRMPTLNVKGKNIVDGSNLYHIFINNEPDVIIIEEVHAMPSQGVTSMFSFGRSYGTILGVISAYQYHSESQLIFVPPQTWKRHYGLLKGQKDDVLLMVSDEQINKEKNKQFRISFTEALLINQYGRLKYAHS